jgi:hypothetical protein
MMITSQVNSVRVIVIVCQCIHAYFVRFRLELLCLTDPLFKRLNEMDPSNKQRSMSHIMPVK